MAALTYYGASKGGHRVWRRLVSCLIFVLCLGLMACGGQDSPSGPSNPSTSSSSSSSSSSSGQVKPSNDAAEKARLILKAHTLNAAENQHGALSAHYADRLGTALANLEAQNDPALEQTLFNLLARFDEGLVDHEADVLDILADLPADFEISPVARTISLMGEAKTGFYLVDQGFGAAAGRYRQSRMVDIGHEAMIDWRDDTAGVPSDLLRGILRWLTAEHAQAYTCRKAACSQQPVRVATFVDITPADGYAVELVNVDQQDRILVDEYPVAIMPNKWLTDAQAAMLQDYIDQGGNVLVMGKVWQNDEVNQNAVDLMAPFGLRPTKNWSAYNARQYQVDWLERNISVEGSQVFSDGPNSYPLSLVSSIKVQAEQIKSVFAQTPALRGPAEDVLAINAADALQDFLLTQGWLAEQLAQAVPSVSTPTGLVVSSEATFGFSWTMTPPLNQPQLYQYSTDGGMSWAQTASNPQRLPNIPLGANQLQVRQRVSWPQFGLDISSTAAIARDGASPAAPDDFALQIDQPIGITHDGMGRTVWGRNDGVGVDLVVVAESFIAGDEQQFLKDAERAMIYMFGDTQPGIALHRNGWNIHFLFAESNERGTDYVKEECDDETWTECSVISVADSVEETRPEYFKDTRFNSGRFCAGRSPNVKRLLCGDSAAALDYARQYYPQVDQVILLVNSNVYGGAGGPIAVSAKGSLSVFVHELGHSFAGLADEYGGNDETQKNRVFPSVLHNVTTEKNPLNVPWKHWLDVTPVCDSATQNNAACFFQQSNWQLGGRHAIGYYEGGSYTDEGVWRPTVNSLMRSTGPLFAVNTEIWAHKVYRIRGVFDALYPLPDGISDDGRADSIVDIVLPRGQAQNFAISLGFGTTVQSVEWKFNGQVSNTDQALFAVPASQQTDYTVSVSVQDRTGSIRIDPNKLTSRTFTWQVTLSDSVAQLSTTRSKARAEATKYSSIEASFTWYTDADGAGEHHQLKDIRRLNIASVPSDFPYPHLDELIDYQVRDAHGKVLYRGQQGMGRQLRAAGISDGSYADHATQWLTEGQYSIRFPYHRDAQSLAIRKAGRDWQVYEL